MHPKKPKPLKQVAIIYKPVGDEPYVTELFAEGHKHRRYRKIYDGNDELNCATALVGGYVERVHLGGRAFVFCNENGLLIGLPKNSCGFVGDFFIANLHQSGSFIGLTEDDKRRAMKWIEMVRPVEAPDEIPKMTVQALSPDEWEQRRKAVLDTVRRRNEEWKAL